MRKKERKRNFEKLRATQGCLTDCVAFFLNKHPHNVPYFVYPREGWAKRLRAFFKKHGYTAFWLNITEVPKRGTHIVCGNSLKWKTYAHVVVYKDGKLVYDPQYPSKWENNRITHRLILTPYKNPTHKKN